MLARLRSPIAWRLALWFLVLSLIPIGLMAILVRRSVEGAFVRVVAEDTRNQARIVAASLPPLEQLASVRALVNAAADDMRTAFVVDADGGYLAHPDPRRLGRPSADDYLLETVERYLHGGEGVVHELASGRIIGYAALPDGEAVVVVAAEPSVVAMPLRLVTSAVLVQLVWSMLVVYLIGGVVLWRIVGPIQSLTRAAGAIGAGNLQVRIDPAEMSGELRVLAEAFNQMTCRLRESYATLEGRVAERTAELETLNAVAGVVSRSLDLDEVLCAALGQVLEAMGFPCGMIHLVDPESGTLELRCEQGLPEADRGAAAHAPIAGRAVAGAAPVVVADLRSLEEVPTEVLAAGFRFAASFPLTAKGQVLGALSVLDLRPRQPASSDLDLLAAICGQIGVAVENARLYEQARRLAALEERQRLARDLHDAVSQSLYAVSMLAEAAARQVAAGDPGAAAGSLDQLRATAREALLEMRLLILELRPPILRDAGLVGALQMRLEAVERRAGLRVELHAEPIDPLPEDIEEGLYWLAQEALNNAIKHARAGRILVSLTPSPGGIRLEVADDGIGFDPERIRNGGGQGLRNMRERAAAIGARLAIEPRPEGGTVLRVLWAAPAWAAGRAKDE